MAITMAVVIAMVMAMATVTAMALSVARAMAIEMDLCDGVSFNGQHADKLQEGMVKTISNEDASQSIYSTLF